MGLRRKLLYLFGIVYVQNMLFAAPVVQKICNDTDLGFYILVHGDKSECTLHNKSIIINPKTIFSHEFLLEKDGQGLILRPIFYKDPQTGILYWFVQQGTYEYDQLLIHKAYQAWLERTGNKKYKNNVQVWFNEWVGQDISVTFDPLEVWGYLLDLSRVRIKNFKFEYVQWLSFAKGIFSKLVLSLNITMLPRKGIIAKAIVHHGQGGICMNGIVERI